MRRAILLSVLFVAGCRRGPANDTYAVYEAVLPAGRPCVVRASPARGFDSVGRFFLEGLALKESGPSGKSQAIHDLLDQRAAVQPPIEAGRFGRRDVRVISDHDFALLEGRPPSWIDRLLRRPTSFDAFARARPGVPGVQVLTPVGFSRDRKTAFVCRETEDGQPTLAECSVLTRADDGTWWVRDGFPQTVF